MSAASFLSLSSSSLRACCFFRSALPLAIDWILVAALSMSAASFLSLSSSSLRACCFFRSALPLATAWILVAALSMSAASFLSLSSSSLRACCFFRSALPLAIDWILVAALSRTAKPSFAAISPAASVCIFALRSMCFFRSALPLATASSSSPSGESESESESELIISLLGSCGAFLFISSAAPQAYVVLPCVPDWFTGKLKRLRYFSTNGTTNFSLASSMRSCTTLLLSEGLVGRELGCAVLCRKTGFVDLFFGSPAAVSGRWRWGR